MPIKRIILDLGGVLFHDGGTKIYARLQAEKGYDPDLLRKVFKSEQRRQALRGNLSDSEFWAWAKSLLPISYDIDYIERTYYDCYQLDEDVFKLILELKTLYPLMIFSNNLKAKLMYLENKYHFAQYFDKALYSYDAGYTKPEPEFFNIMISKLDCAPTEAFLIDDQPINIEFVFDKYKMPGATYSEGQILHLREELKKNQILSS